MDEEERDPTENEILKDVVVEQARDIMVLKRLARDFIKTLRMAGDHSGVLVAFAGKAIRKYQDLEMTDEYRAIPSELKEVIGIAEVGAEFLAINKAARKKDEKGGGGSENIQ